MSLSPTRLFVTASVGASLVVFVPPGPTARADGQAPSTSDANGQACVGALEQRAARDLACPVAGLWEWPAEEDGPPGGVEVEGCGLRATYILRGTSDCIWDTAARPTPDPDAAPNELRLDLGLGAPTGVAGVTYHHTLGAIFAAEPGVGWGLSGTQLAFMLRVRNIPILHEPGVGASLAIGPGAGWLIGGKSGPILWLDVEPLAVEHRFANGVLLGLGAGLVLPLSGAYAECRSTCGPVETHSGFEPAFRFSVGEWF